MSKISISKNSHPKKIPLLKLQEDFLKKEADKLNSEIEKLLEETRSRERYSLTIIAGVAVWIFTHLTDTNTELLIGISFIPVIVTSMYAVSVKYLYDNIKWAGTYLRRIEDYFLEETKDGNNEMFWGWEKYFDDENKKSRYVGITKKIWIFQLILALFMVILVCLKDEVINKTDADKNKNVIQVHLQ